MPRSLDVEHSEVQARAPSDSLHASHSTTENAIKNAHLINTPVGEERWRRIAELAYRRAERRGFAPGGEVDDWLAAEREFDAGGGSSTD